METKDARRRRKLELLINGTEGGLEVVATASGRSPEYIKQIIKGVLLPPKKDGTRSARALGDSAAESLEDAFFLGRGWFDSDRPLPQTGGLVARERQAEYVNQLWPFTKVNSYQYHLLLPKERELVEEMILRLLDARTDQTKHFAPGTNSVAA